MDLMVRLKELQRRIDQMIGVPKVSERERSKYTINARLSRLEEQVHLVNTKLDDCLNFLRKLPVNNVNSDIKQISN